MRCKLKFATNRLARGWQHPTHTRRRCGVEVGAERWCLAQIAPLSQPQTKTLERANLRDLQRDLRRHCSGPGTGGGKNSLPILSVHRTSSPALTVRANFSAVLFIVKARIPDASTFRRPINRGDGCTAAV